MKTFIGKKVTVSIGGQPPVKDPDEIVGSEITVHVSDTDLSKYDRIVGEETNLTIGSEIDSQVEKIVESIKKTDSPKKEEIVMYCEKILSERDSGSKLLWIRKLISFAADVAQISSLIIQLAASLPK